MEIKLIYNFTTDCSCDRDLLVKLLNIDKELEMKIKIRQVYVLRNFINSSTSSDFNVCGSFIIR